MAVKLKFRHVEPLPEWAGPTPCAGGRCTELAVHLIVKDLTGELEVNTPVCCQCLFELFGIDPSLAAAPIADAAAEPVAAVA